MKPEVSISDTIRHQKHSWLGHVLKHDGLLKNIFKCTMTGKPARRRKRLNILGDLAEKE